MKDDEDLKKAAATVDYETWMLMETSERLRGRLPMPSDEIARRAILESFVLHLRALIEFFSLETKNNDDVRAKDFFDPGSDEFKAIQGLAPAKDSWEMNRYKEMHKLLGHIVDDRARFDSDWTVWDLQIITSRLETFFEALKPARRPWFPRSGAWFANTP